MRIKALVFLILIIAAPAFAENIYDQLSDLESKTTLVKRQQELLSATSQLDTTQRQAQIQRIQGEIQMNELRQKGRQMGGSNANDPKVISVMGVEGRLEAALSFSDGSSKTFRTGDVLPGGGKIVGITDSEVLVSRGGKKNLVSLPYAAPQEKTSMDISVYQPTNPETVRSVTLPGSTQVPQTPNPFIPTGIKNPGASAGMNPEPAGQN